MSLFVDVEQIRNIMLNHLVQGRVEVGKRNLVGIAATRDVANAARNPAAAWSVFLSECWLCLGYVWSFTLSKDQWSSASSSSSPSSPLACQCQLDFPGDLNHVGPQSFVALAQR